MGNLGWTSRVASLTVLIVLGVIPAQTQSPGPKAGLQQQLEQTQLQRAANQRLMLDAASEMVGASVEYATSQGDLSSAESAVRLAEIVREIKVAARNDDAISAGNLIAEAGTLIGPYVLAKVKEAAENLFAAADAVGGTASYVVSAGQAYLNFTRLSAEDARLLRREADLRQQLEQPESLVGDAIGTGNALLSPEPESANAPQAGIAVFSTTTDSAVFTDAPSNPQIVSPTSPQGYLGPNAFGFSWPTYYFDPRGSEGVAVFSTIPVESQPFTEAPKNPQIVAPNDDGLPSGVAVFSQGPVPAGGDTSQQSIYSSDYNQAFANQLRFAPSPAPKAQPSWMGALPWINLGLNIFGAFGSRSSQIKPPLGTGLGLTPNSPGNNTATGTNSFGSVSTQTKTPPTPPPAPVLNPPGCLGPNVYGFPWPTYYVNCPGKK